MRESSLTEVAVSEILLVYSRNWCVSRAFWHAQIHLDPPEVSQICLQHWSLL